MGKSKFKALSKVFDGLDSIVFNPKIEKYVVFSDGHIGMLEFDENRKLYLKALDYYYQEGFNLIISGDNEELHRYGIESLKDKYRKDVYAKENKFLQQKRYHRIFGNHDIDWRKQKRVEKNLHDVLSGLEIVEGLKFEWNGNFIFLAHGHQGDLINDKLGKLGRMILRWIARPLGISSGTSPARNYSKRRKDETEYYEWAKSRKVLFIAGHTHRPMFESLTKADRIRIDIENRVREYISEKDPGVREKLKAEIKAKKEWFEKARKKAGAEDQRLRLGRAELFTPCYFNDGSCLHKNGITCIELCQENIKLVFIYDRTEEANRDKELRAPTFRLLPGDPEAKNYMRQILEEEKLEYIFTRIQLLS